MPRYSNADVLRWFNMAQDWFARNTLMFQGKYDVPLQTSVSSYPLPGDFISVKNVTYVYADSTIEEPLNETGIAAVSQSKFTGGIPCRFAIWSNKIELDSTIGSGVVRLWYYRTPRHITDVGEVNGQNEIPPRFAETVSHYATFLMLLTDEELTRARMFHELAMNGVQMAQNEFVNTSHEAQSIMDSYDPISGSYLKV